MAKAIQIQHEYYTNTALKYHDSHVANEANNEHDFALFILSAMIRKYKIKKLLDVGAGTGRTLQFLLKEHPDMEILGIEPVDALREAGYANGIPKNILIAGNGNALDFEKNEFDLVCEFGVLHHVEKPQLLVSEMLRVSKKYLFISDSNNFGQGNSVSRFFKQSINFLRLWRAFDFVMTKGKCYHYSEGDGIFYSYSVYNNYNQILKSACDIYITNTKGNGINCYKNASHIALFAVKN